jgi:hypothetical protein
VYSQILYAIVHVIIDPRNCSSNIEGHKLNNLLDEWAFPGLDNDIFHRLTSGQVRGQLLGDIYSTVCTMQIIEEVQCIVYELI